MARIYVSSTSEDLKQCRKAVLSALRRMRHDGIGMEDYTATDGPPLDECLEDVATCDVYIGLFAWRYGYIPNDDDNNPNQKSITELEFRKAQAIGIPCYIFLLDEKAAWPFHHLDQELNNIRTLRDYFCKAKIVDFFTDENTLATKVSTTLVKWERSLVKASITLEEHKTRLEQREKELRDELSTEKNQGRIGKIEHELSSTQEQLTNLDHSYQQTLKRNEEYPMINKWKKLTEDNQVKLIIVILVAVFSVVGYFGKSWFESPSQSSKPVPTSVVNTVSQGGVIQKNQAGKNVVNTGSGTINIGIAPERSDQRPNQNEDKVTHVFPNEAKLTVTQTTSADNSPAVSGTKGDVTININGSGSGKQP